MEVRANLTKARRAPHRAKFGLDDPSTGLQVRCVGVEYNDFPTVEWVVHFKNTGATDTPILSDIQAVEPVRRASASSSRLSRKRA